MIWCRGELVADESLSVSVLDRTFEHGLGLFESLRTWNGHATLLARHLERMVRSAERLGLPFDMKAFPDEAAVRALILANGVSGDARLRITMSGGRYRELPGGASTASTVWMTAAPLTPLEHADGAIVDAILNVTHAEPLDQCKTLNYWGKARAHEQARAAGLDDAACVTPEGWLCETTRYNLCFGLAGRLRIPARDLPMLPGVMRGLVIERALALGIEIEECRLVVDDLRSIDEAFLTNSVRGIVPIARLFDRELVSPGPLSQRLWGTIRPWLESGGKEHR